MYRFIDQHHIHRKCEGGEEDRWNHKRDEMIPRYTGM